MDFLTLDRLLDDALAEDIGRGDVTTDPVVEANPDQTDAPTTARVIAREPLVLSGWEVFVRTFGRLGTVVAHPVRTDGDFGGAGELGTLEGLPSVLLKGERVALNLLQRLSGIATLTRQFVERVEGTGTRIVDTRKTTPLWRTLEKYSVRMGGGYNHRLGLDDAILIKENHIAIAGSINAAVVACRTRAGHLHKVEVEVTNVEELDEALEAGADVVMLDNMSPDDVRSAVKRVSGRCLVEVSGGIDLHSVRDYAEAGADLISVGRLTHSFRSSDISLLIDAG